eukprot:5547461-Karenia_brevis.AAC.1
MIWSALLDHLGFGWLQTKSAGVSSVKFIFVSSVTLVWPQGRGFSPHDRSFIHISTHECLSSIYSCLSLLGLCLDASVMVMNEGVVMSMIVRISNNDAPVVRHGEDDGHDG